MVKDYFWILRAKFVSAVSEQHASELSKADPVSEVKLA